MKTLNKLPATIFLLSIFLFGCMEEDPYANFSVSENVIETGQSVSFTNSSTDASSYEWYFGDGNSSTEVNPSHTYNQMGFYLVTLIAYSKSGRKMDEAYHFPIAVVDPTILTFNVTLNNSPLANCLVVIFDDYYDWYNDVNSVASGNTNSSGKISFTGCTNTVYYADFYYNNNFYGTVVTDELTLFTENIYNVNLTDKQLTINNPTFTPITIEVSGFSTRTIPVGGSTTYNVSTSSVTFNANTYGTYSGSPVALNISWGGTINLPDAVTNITLDISNSFFYLFFRNNSGYTLGPTYTNYGSSSYQVVISSTIPSNNVEYGLGYHHARSNTEIRFYLPDGVNYYYANNGVHFSFSNSANQFVSLWAGSMSAKAAANIGEGTVLAFELDSQETISEYRKMFKETPETIRLFPKGFTNN